MSTKKGFRFKKFDIDHSRSTMKVGTDGVLIGAWTTVESPTRVLDIGTGSGLIAIMLAQRSPEHSHIDAVEISERDATQARLNVDSSPWPQKVSIHHCTIQGFHAPQKYQLIVTNPPYFNRSLHPPDQNRLQARHTTSLTYEDIIDAVLRLMESSGIFSIILPPTEGELFVDLASKHNLHLVRKCVFRTREEKKPERWMMEFRTTPALVEEESLTLYLHGEVWTDAYKALTRDFYLNA